MKLDECPSSKLHCESLNQLIHLKTRPLPFQVRKSMKPLNLLSKTKNILSGKDKEKKEARRRAISASAGDVCAAGEGCGEGRDLSAAASEPDLRDTQVSY